MYDIKKGITMGLEGCGCKFIKEKGLYLYFEVPKNCNETMLIEANKSLSIVGYGLKVKRV